MRKSVALTSILALVIVLEFGPSSVPAQVTDAHLIGEWVGTWTSTLYQDTGLPPGATPRGIKNNGEYHLTITKVEGGRVYARVQQPGMPLPEFNVVATLNQNVIYYANERIKTELTVDGNRMKGTRLGGQAPWQISLQKKK